MNAPFQFAGGTPGSANQARATESLQRAMELKARIDRRRHLADEARIHRLPGETLAAAVRRLERELAA